MLKFIFGRAATGKTSKILELIKEDVKNNKKAVLIIPEQFSFESERAVLKLLGDRLASSVEVLSFSRICDAVERIVGGMCGRTLNEADKLILMCKAIRNCADDLKLFRKYKNSLGFAKTMLSTIDEFKSNAVTPEMLFDFSNNNTETSLSAKLFDIATIYENFGLQLGEKFIDPIDRLSKLYYQLKDCRYFENKTVYIDSFKNFTGQQYKIIDRILSSAENLTVSFTSDGKNTDVLDIFSNIRQTTEYIKNLAKAKGVKTCEDLVLEKSYYKSNDLLKVEGILSENHIDNLEYDDALTVVSASTVYDEAEFVARTIRRLVRENRDFRYRDFVIIARDTAPYEEAVVSACQKNDVSIFLDKRYTLSSFPPVLAALSAIDAVSGFSSDAIFRFYKSGAAVVDEEMLSKLENYTYIWNIGGKLWTDEWDMNPKGFIQGEMDEKTILALKELNEARVKLITPFISFKKDFTGDAKNRITAILKLFSSVNYKKALNSMCDTYDQNSDEIYKQALVQSWDEFMSVLNSIAECMGNADISTKEFTEILKTAVNGAQIGIAPQMLDEVSFGAADRIRPSRPKVAFIMGANQNEFPRGIVKGGLFADSEREKLILSGIQIPDHSVKEAVDEEFLVYTNVCCPTEKLYISYHNIDAQGAECAPSPFVVELIEKIGCRPVIEPKPICEDNLPETKESAFSRFCKSFGSNSSDAKTILASISENDQLREKVELIKGAYQKRDMSISPGTAEKLFGNNLKISPSKLDTFMRCSFSYLCKYGFRAKKLQIAEFDVMQRGTIVHYVLERIISEYKEKVSEFDEQKISELVDLYVNKYLDSINGYRSIENGKMRYLVFTISRSLKEVVAHLSREFAQSGFKPCRCELFIGGDEVPSPEIAVDENKKISVEGYVDRMDIWNGYIRIVDYKTGSRKFRLPDILVGQNMQMLIYLYAIVKNGDFSGNKPAGIFYMPSRRDLKNEGMRMDGLAAENLELITAMEAENKGEFVTPLKYTKTGDLYSTCKNSFISENDFSAVFSHIENHLYKMGDKIYNGQFSVNPVDGLDSEACKYCDFASVCSVGNEDINKVESISNSEVIERIKEEMK